MKLSMSLTPMEREVLDMMRRGHPLVRTFERKRASYTVGGLSVRETVVRIMEDKGLIEQVSDGLPLADLTQTWKLAA